MNANILKTAYEKFPIGLKKAFSPLFVRSMVESPTFKATWRALDEFEALDAANQDRRQFELLKKTLSYAGEYVPYYTKTFDEVGFDPMSMEGFHDIKKLPLLEKSQAVELGAELHSVDKRLDVYSTFTGGSSGQALEVVCDKQSIYRERAFACHSYAKYGFDIYNSKTAAFWGHNKGADYYYSPLKNEIVISPFRLYRENSATGIIRDIKEFGAEYLAGYPSAIFQLAKMVSSEPNCSAQFKHVFYYAENYEDDKKAFVEDVFCCSSSSNYGHTEHAVFADIDDYGCHFNKMYGYTELLPTDEPDEYRIICTGFTNMAMPLIRYATDDVLRIRPDEGMEIIGHKKSDVYLEGRGGVRVFKGAMTLHINELKKVYAYQYFQTEPGRAKLLIVENERLTEEDKKAILNYLKRRTEGVLDIEIEIVESVARTARGKAIWAISTINKSGL